MLTISLKESKYFKTKESAFLEFPYNENYIKEIKTLEKRYWHSTTKQWEIEIEAVPYILKIFSKETITIIGSNKIYLNHLISSKESEETRRGIPKLYLKSTLMKHQVDAVSYAINQNSMLLGDDPGLGKTLSIMASALARRKLDNYKHTLIVCCVNNLKWNWVEEITKHTHEIPYILGQKTNKNGNVFIGGIKDKLMDLERIPSNYFWITNIETLRNKEVAEKVQKLCNEHIINYIAVDESHKLSGPTAQQTKGLLSLEPDCRVMMTGTPMDNPLDLWVPLHWLGIEQHNFYQYKKHYTLSGGYKNKEVTGYKFLEDLQEDLNKVMLRRLKKDVVDLPEKIYTNEYVEMNADQKIIYDEIKAQILENVDKIILSSNPLAEMLRLRQVTSNPNIVTTQEVSCAKLERLDDILKERISSGRKCLVVSNWTQVTDPLLERYKQYNPATITGNIKDNERKTEEHKLNEDPNCHLLIGTISSIGVGLTLTGADTCIFIDEPWRNSTKVQMGDRIHRIGMKGGAELITLLTKDTIDERVHDIVEEKKELADYVIDGALKGKREQLVKFLLS